jgi:hypothetical protein
VRNSIYRRGRVALRLRLYRARLTKISRLKDAINTLTKRKTRNRRYIRVEETPAVNKVSNLIAEKEGSSREDGKIPAKRVRAERRCGCCSEVGHNSRTCKVEIEDVDNSNASD